MPTKNPSAPQTPAQKKSGVISLLIYAILVTILAVTVTYQLSKLTENLVK